MRASTVMSGSRKSINQSAIRGEPHTGYESPKDLGEFECENCKYFSDGECRQKDMKKFSKRPRAKNGNVLVEPAGCCEYVFRVGRKDNDQ